MQALTLVLTSALDKEKNPPIHSFIDEQKPTPITAPNSHPTRTHRIRHQPNQPSLPLFFPPKEPQTPTPPPSTNQSITPRSGT